MPNQVRVVFNHLPAIAAQLPASAGTAVQETCNQLADTARSLAPVLTGALRDSITVEADGPTSGTVSATARHALYKEYGTAKHGAAQPFMTPAGEQGRPVLEESMARNIIQGL